MAALVLDWVQRKNHPVFSNLNLDHYASLTGVDFLRRVFEPDEPIRFSIMFFVSDKDSGTDRTALRFPDGTDEDWQRNMEDLKERGCEFTGNAYHIDSLTTTTPSSRPPCGIQIRSLAHTQTHRTSRVRPLHSG
jgi:hypothetical protein